MFYRIHGQRIEPSLKDMFKSDHQKRPLGSFTLADLGGGTPTDQLYVRQCKFNFLATLYQRSSSNITGNKLLRK